MTQISNFEELRADGNIIAAGMSFKEMLTRDWPPSKVVALRWKYRGEAVEFAVPFGVNGKVVPGETFIAANVCDDQPCRSNRLVILTSSGTEHGQLENIILFHGRDLRGRWGWFEQAITSAPDTFGVVFQTTTDGDFRCDIDARALRVVKVFPIR
jgi:hypothetical protein